MCEWDSILIRLMESSRMIVVLYKRYNEEVNFFVDAGVIGVDQACRHDREALVIAHVKSI